MNTQKTFCNSDRYTFDYDICSYKKGFAQIDTTEDASYFGNWVNFKAKKSAVSIASFILFSSLEIILTIRAVTIFSNFEGTLKRLKASLGSNTFSIVG